MNAMNFTITLLSDSVGGCKVSQCYIMLDIGHMQRVMKSEPHHFDYPNLLTCKFFIRVVRSSIVESHLWIWKHHNLFNESQLCLSTSISHLGLYYRDFHSYDCTCVKCSSLVCCIIHSSIASASYHYHQHLLQAFTFVVRSNLSKKIHHYFTYSRVSLNNKQSLIILVTK